MDKAKLDAVTSIYCQTREDFATIGRHLAGLAPDHKPYRGTRTEWELRTHFPESEVKKILESLQVAADYETI